MSAESAKVRDAILRLAVHGETKKVRQIASVVLVLHDHGAARIWNEQEAAQVAADVLATLDHEHGHRS